MSKTTTKTTTVTEKFDKEGNLTERVTETVEEIFDDPTPPNTTPWLIPTYPSSPYITYGGISQVQCTCLQKDKPCMKHTTLTNNPAGNTTTVRIADGEATFATDEGPVVIKGSQEVLKGIRVIRYGDATIAEDAVSEGITDEDDEGCCGGSSCA